ncbi:beta-Ala-His dipeptidase [Purpureocillium lilacinum]|uniref:Beta-Ala-His dipeptidase n=1 Tax=Purpureocillium lilacinum TaxID=33203 RepID=A0A179GZ67_PURLI|nr:beta-Ala-His dipeptidase [Purpureocillium lilacinum]
MPTATAQPDLSSSVATSLEAPDCPENPPELVHSLRHNSTILALAVSPQHDTIFAGTQDGEIVAWSLSTFHQVSTVQAHKRSILSLSLSPDGSLLFSSAGDPIISVWCPRTLRRLYEIYGTHDVGDIFCSAYSPQHETLYIGAQNTTIQWVTLNDAAARVSPSSQSHPDRRSHRFFDSKAIGGTSTPRRNEDRWGLIPKAQAVLEIDAGSVRPFAHYGYVYCMLMAKGPTVEVDADDDVLISGGGDGTIKLWRLGSSSKDRRHDEDGEHGGIDELMTLGTDDAESVLSLALDGSFLYAGKLDGIVELWDLDTTQRLRVIKAHEGNVMSLQMGWGYLWTGSTDGWSSKYSTAHYGAYKHASAGDVSQKYQCLSTWKAHQGKILASATTTYNDNKYYITGANDNDITIWSVKDKACSKPATAEESDDLLVSTLSDFVSYKTVSSRPEFAEDCRKGATFLGSLFKRLGGHVELLSTEKAHNPVVYAKFSGKKEAAETRKRILFYGHYDVVAADGKKGKWASDPFTVKGTNGFLYGRGVSDNKGPIIAALYAVTDLMQAQKLENDVIFLIEGEEEFGSRGFEEAVKRHKSLIGHVDYILLANSYWLDDEVPCLTYGLRGVLHATVCVDAPRPDIHSGVDGSYMMDEPLSDLTGILSKLKGAGNRIQIPGFYDGIPAMTPEEEARYDDIASIMREHKGEAVSEEKLKRSLMARWREPNLTIHRYKVSGPDGSLVSSHASSHISLRLVPGQEVDQVTSALKWFLRREFSHLKSQNSLSINIDNKAEPWLGDPTNAIFRTLGQAIIEAWPNRFDSSSAPAPAAPVSGTVGKGASRPKGPLFIREGGSIPAIRFLEKEFGAPAAHLPCGRASDAAHLDNERMCLVNLLKAREIFGKVFARL